MKNPVVLIVGREVSDAVGVRGPTFGIGRTYAHAITRAGGIPIILPPIVDLRDQLETLLSRCDANVQHGGGDIDPKRYGRWWRRGVLRVGSGLWRYSSAAWEERL